MSQGADIGPSLEQFLTVPASEVARVMPETVVYITGGTRRSAVLAGISLQSDEYARWTRERMIACFELLFRFGARHIFTTMIRPGQFAEVGRYRDRLLDWLDWGLAGPEALATYAQRGWRVRLLGADGLGQLGAAAKRLRQAMPGTGTPALWYYVVPEVESPWQWVREALNRAEGNTTT